MNSLETHLEELVDLAAQEINKMSENNTQYDLKDHLLISDDSNVIKFIEYLQELIRTVNNKEEDLGNRLISFNKLNNIFGLCTTAVGIIENSLTTGHILSHPTLQTSFMKQCGWGNDDINIEELIKNV